MPETCGCKVYPGYQVIGTDNPRHVPPYIGKFCPLHARAAEMRELLAQTPTLLNPEGRRETEWVAKVMALLEETK